MIGAGGVLRSRGRGDVIVPDSAPDSVKRRHRGLEDVLPDDTVDDRPDLVEVDSEAHDRWLRDNRPPHHDIAR